MGARTSHGREQGFHHVAAKFSWLLVGVALITILPLTSGASVSALTASATLPTLHWYVLDGTATWSQTLDPALATDERSIGPIDLIGAGLVKLLPNGHVIPDLATWRISKNRRVYWFTLRHNARFNNGDQVTAQDAVFSLTRALAKSTNSPVAPLYLGHILGATRLNTGKTNRLQGVRALNSRTVQITLDKPIAFFLETLSYNTDIVLDARIMAGKPPQTYLTNTCTANVGAGPFMYVCRNGTGQLTSFYPPGHTPTMTLVPNPYYYGPKPHIRIVASAIADDGVNYRDYQANGVDVTHVPLDDVPANSHLSGFHQLPVPSVDFILPNLTAAPFSNVHCRLALAYATDRATIGNKVLRHALLPIYSIVPRGFVGYYAGNDNPHYNPASAQAELKQCPGGIHHVQLVYWRLSADSDSEFSALQYIWSKLGIDVTLRGLPTNPWLNVYTKPLSKTGTPLFQGVWSADYPDPEDFFRTLLYSGAGYNPGQYSNPTYDRLVDQADVTVNAAKRAQLYIRAEHLAISQGALITLGQEVSYALVKPYVHGLVAAPFLYPTIAPRGNNWANVSISPH